MIEQVKKYIESNGFSLVEKDSKYENYLEEIGLEDIFVNQQENEMYIVKGKKEPIALNEVKLYIDKIAGFTMIFPNKSISYNINLVFVCPLEKKHHNDEFLNLKNRINVERDKYYCRKFVINSKAKSLEEELDTLPVRSVSVHIKEQFSGYDDLNKDIIEIIGDTMFHELSKTEKPSLESILELINIE